MSILRPQFANDKRHLGVEVHGELSSGELENLLLPATPREATGQLVSRPTEIILFGVPDYIQADWLFARPRLAPHDSQGQRLRGRRRIGEGLRWAIHQAVIVQKSARVILADVVLAQVLWGGDRSRWNRNWRQRLVRRLKAASTGEQSGLVRVTHREAEFGERSCTPGCPLNGTRTQHQHLEVVVRTESVTSNGPEGGKDDDSRIEYDGAFLGCLEVFGGEDYPERSYHWKVRPMPPEPVMGEFPGERDQNKSLLERIRRLKRAGRLTAIYFPPKLFGPSPRSGLSYQQRQLHQAITRELTRGKGKSSGRPDRAEIQIGGKVADENASFTVAPCPYLEARCRYVAFNGNGKGLRRHLHGRGYKLAVWMQKARYAMHEEAKEHWIEVRRFLRDLEGLAGVFGLVVAAWHPRKHVWRAQEDLVAMTRTSAGRSWLWGCLLRIYTRDDFLLRWRRFFAAGWGSRSFPTEIARKL
jgi:hypothetical protein